MRAVFISLALLPALIFAHGDIPGAPKIWGWQGDDLVPELNALLRPVEHLRQAVALRKRQDEPEKRCGPGVGACAASECCSNAGYCGIGEDYCTAPDCLFNFGAACDTNIIPRGASTESIARPKLGSVPYGGAGIYSCKTPGTIALTYDDGPFNYTGHVLDLLKKYNAKATFFITGNNIGKGQIDNAYFPWHTVIKRAYAEGHQIASHTWGHQDLSQITQQQRRQQMISNEMALRNILGLFPTYMRPPYSSCDSACALDLEELGYHVIYFDLDTEDYLNTLPAQIQTPRNNFLGNISSKPVKTSDWLVISHDIHQQTAYSLTEFTLQKLTAAGFKSVTVGQCLGDPEVNWYRKSAGSVFTAKPIGDPISEPTPTPVQSGPAKKPSAVSEDGTCAGQSGNTCMKSTFGNCCSHAGWCGSTKPYCGDGCQAGYGDCGAK